MAAVASPDDGRALPGRVWILEHDQTATAEKLSKVDDNVVKIAEVQAVHTVQIATLQDTGEKLAGALNKVLWALITLALTIAGSAVGVMLTLGGGGA